MVKHIAEHEFVKKVRYMEALTIFFATKDAIYITDGKNHVLLERWFDGRNIYSQHWRPLTQVLLHRKNLSNIHVIWRLARKYEVCAHTPRCFPEIPNDVKEIRNE